MLASLLSRSYDHINALVYYENGESSLGSRCECAFVSGLPSWLEMIALCVNLAIWANFVLTSIVHRQGEMHKNVVYRAWLQRCVVLYALFFVTVPCAVLTTLDCRYQVPHGFEYFLVTTFTAFAVF